MTAHKFVKLANTAFPFCLQAEVRKVRRGGQQFMSDGGAAAGPRWQQDLMEYKGLPSALEEGPAKRKCRCCHLSTPRALQVDKHRIHTTACGMVTKCW
jgi:hypothetical protein